MKIDTFKNIGHALGSEPAVAFDCTKLEDMHRYYLTVTRLTRTQSKYEKDISSKLLFL